MRCEEARNRIEERQDDLLAPEEAAAFDAHVGACPACAHEVREAGAFETLLHAAGDPGREEGAVQRLSVALGAARQSRRRTWLALAAAAAALLVGVLLLTAFDAAPDPLTRGEIAELEPGRQVRVGRARLHVVTAARLTLQPDGQTVRLDSGAVRFRVDPDSTPFSVETPAGFVRVLGTEFEVRVMQKRDWIGVGVVTTVLVTSGLVLLENTQGKEEAEAGTVAVMRAGHAPQLLDAAAVTALVEENEKLKARLAAQSAGSGQGPILTTQAPAQAPARTAPKTASPEAGEGETPAAPGSAVDKEIGETDWARMGKAMLVVLGAEEESERQPSPDETVERAYVMSRLATLAAAMDRRMGPEVLLDERVRRRFLSGLLSAALPEKDAAARSAVIDELTRALGAADDEGDGGLLRIESLVRRTEAASRAATAVQADLEGEENVIVLRLLALLQQGFGRSVSMAGSSTEEGLVESVRKSLIERMKIEAADRPATLAPVQRFVSAHLAARAALREQYGVDAHDLLFEEEKTGATLGVESAKRARLDAALRFSRIQAAMERAVHDDMPAAVQELMRAASLYWYMVRVSEK